MSRNHHYLKTLPEFYIIIENGQETFEVRFKNIFYQKGDMLHIKEFYAGEYTGREMQFEVKHFLDNPKYYKNKYVVMRVEKWRESLDEKDKAKVIDSLPNPEDRSNYPIEDLLNDTK